MAEVRPRSRLWIGTALSKDGEHAHAASVMTAAAREFEDLGEAEDWSVAHQKLALAYRGAGNLTEAQRLITIAGASGTTGTPMQKVRLSTAQAHILLSGTGTAPLSVMEVGLAMFRMVAPSGAPTPLTAMPTDRRPPIPSTPVMGASGAPAA